MKFFVSILAIVFSGQLLAAESFLTESEVAKLVAVPDLPGIQRYEKPGLKLGSYEKLLFGGVTLFFSDSSKSKGIDAAEVKEISDEMRAAMAQAAGSDIEVAEAPGPSTVIINVAITEIDLQNKKRGLLGYTPIGLVVTAAGNASGSRLQLKNAQIQGEMVDSVSGEVVAFFQISEIPMKKGEKTRSWDDVSATFEKLLEQRVIAVKK